MLYQIAWKQMNIISWLVLLLQVANLWFWYLGQEASLPCPSQWESTIKRQNWNLLVINPTGALWIIMCWYFPPTTCLLFDSQCSLRIATAVSMQLKATQNKSTHPTHHNLCISLVRANSLTTFYQALSGWYTVHSFKAFSSKASKWELKMDKKSIERPLSLWVFDESTYLSWFNLSLMRDLHTSEIFI